MVDAKILLETARSVKGVHVRSVCARDYCDHLLYYKILDNSAYFTEPLLAAMRGAVVRVYEGGDAKIVAFPFAKFFNYGEVDATRELPQSGFTATEKLDGTLMIVWRDPDTNAIRATTRGMLDTDNTGRVVNPFTERFFAAVERDGLTSELERLVDESKTLMFELVWRVPASKQFDVFKTPVHDKDWRVYLLAYRDMQSYEIEYSVETVFERPRFYDVSSVHEVAGMVDAMSDSEGVVVHYRGLSYDVRYSWWSLMVKFKSKTYLAAIYADSCDRKRWQRLARLVVKGFEDDIYPRLGSEEREFIDAFKKSYREFYYAALRAVEAVQEARAIHGSRVDNFVRHSLRAGYLLDAIEKSNSDVERAVQAIVEKMLLSAKRRESLLRAVESLPRRFKSVADAVAREFSCGATRCSARVSRKAERSF